MATDINEIKSSKCSKIITETCSIKFSNHDKCLKLNNFPIQLQ